MTNEERFIQLKDSESVINIRIKDSNGNDTGEKIVFDLEDFDLPLNLNKSEAMHKRNRENLRNAFIILEKKEDRKGKFLLSWKEEERIKMVKNFYENEMKALDMFIGEGKTQKILDIMGRKPYYTMFDDIMEMLEPILPTLDNSADKLIDKIKNKYHIDEEEVLK